ncbi:MAG: F0F1 ATP synthase subunit B [Clostridia bacterium]|nr:F0F1 ATP synthase subunit B [Clostridia bacterium]MBR4459381.1 F0F1 ATP synthase subunit B [Clostridia bacterium]
MQSQQIISVNLWQIVISLCNLIILFLIVRRFLYKPVKKVLAQRQAHVDGVYEEADEARRRAEADQAAWAERMTHAREEADAIISRAAENARMNSDLMVSDAKNRADGIVRQAEEEALLTRQKAEEGIRRELAGVSAELAEKVLGREINESDHRALIDSFIDELEDSRDADQ